ncbi:TRAP transporter large permease [Phycicoccus flavus]|uniref:TRAP transporter large permease n=1 Tax=Phycicoccus flavus TaxID=2502783 RepID=UPI000FEB9220|nr:TRAP transporter large permease [Phycicoccus flavus]NHA68263.1 TRAP transporter large permease [Phycicoccus flavus]
MTAVVIAFVVFFVLVLLEVPVAYSLLISSSAAVLLASPVPIGIVVERTFASTQSFLLLAVPFFILAGDLLASGKLGRQLVDLAAAVVGRFNGGLGQASVVTSMAFGGVSGSAVADASGIGSVLIPWQTREGYPARFAAAVNAASSTIGVIVPPSIPMIVYASVANVSVAGLFIAGIVPGVLVGVSQLAICWWVAKRNGYPRHRQPFDGARLVKQVGLALPAILMPVLVIVALVGGVATVTEVSVVAAVYALLLRVLVYRDLGLPQLLRILTSTAMATGVVMWLIMTSTALAWLLTVSQLPAQLATWFASAGIGLFGVVLFMNVVMIVVGMFLDMPAAILLLAPVFIPLADAVGLGLLQLGIIMTLNLALGLFTPPVGTTLYISTAIAKEKIENVAKALVPFYVAGLATLLLVSYVPAITITP